VEVKEPVLHVKPSDKQKKEMYGQLLNVTDIDALDKSAFAASRGTYLPLLHLLPT
jgi:hypothetical protein